MVLIVIVIQIQIRIQSGFAEHFGAAYFQAPWRATVYEVGEGVFAQSKRILWVARLFIHTETGTRGTHTHTLTHMAHRHAHTPCLLTAREGAGAAGGEKEEGVGELRASSDLLNVNRKCDDSSQQYPMQMYYSNSINNR